MNLGKYISRGLTRMVTDKHQTLISVNLCSSVADLGF